MEFTNALTKPSWLQVGTRKKRAWWFYDNISSYDRKFWFAGNAPMTYDNGPYQGKTPTEAKDWLNGSTFMVTLSDAVIIASARMSEIIRFDRSMSMSGANWEEYTTHGLRLLFRDGDSAMTVLKNPTMVELRKWNVDFLAVAAVIHCGEEARKLFNPSTTTGA